MKDGVPILPSAMTVTAELPEEDGEYEHRRTGHQPKSPNCITCSLAKQIRKTRRRQTKEDAEKLASQIGKCWWADVVGPITPEGFSGERYALVVVDEATNYTALRAIQNKESITIKVALESIARELGVAPKQLGQLRTDGGTEFRGQVERWLDEACVGMSRAQHHVIPTTSHHWIGKVENRIGEITRMARTGIIDSNLPKKLWKHAMGWATVTYNINNGSYGEIFGEEMALMTRKRLVPFGTLATMKNFNVKDGEKFEPRSMEVAVVGYGGGDEYHVGWMKERKFVFDRTANVKIFAGEVYCPDSNQNVAIRRQRVKDIATQTETQEEMTYEVAWVQCSLCAAWREVPDKEVWKNKQFQCKMIGTTCNNEPDARAWTEPVIRGAFLTTIVPKRDAESAQEFVDGKSYKKAFEEATEKEIRSLEEFGTFEPAMEYKDAVKIIGARFVKGHILRSIKNRELSEEKWTAKARLVALGNKIKTCDEIAFGVRTVGTTSTAVRAVIAMCCLKGWTIEQANVSSAYVHADVSGSPIYMIPPTEWRLKPEMQNPVVRIKKDLYGLPSSGRDWDQHANEKLKELGWEEVDGTDSRVYVKEHGVLVRFVDDLIGGRDPEHGANIWDELKTVFVIKVVEEVGQYVGTNFSVDRNHIEASQVGYCREIVGNFEERYRMIYKKELRGKETPTIEEREFNDAEREEPGDFGDVCRSLVGELSCLANCSRPDISFATNVISRYVDSWNRACDKRTVQIFAYLKKWTNMAIKGKFNMKDLGNFKVVANTDSDYGADITGRSTVGRAIFVRGEDTDILISWRAKRLTKTAISVGEAETLGAIEAAREGFVVAGLIEGLLGRKIPVELQTDSNTVISAHRNGKSTRMGYIKRTQRVAIGFLRDHFVGEDVVKYVESKENRADPFTKHSSGPNMWKNRNLLTVTTKGPLGVVPPQSGGVERCE